MKYACCCVTQQDRVDDNDRSLDGRLPQTLSRRGKIAKIGYLASNLTDQGPVTNYGESVLNSPRASRVECTVIVIFMGEPAPPG